MSFSHISYWILVEMAVNPSSSMQTRWEFNYLGGPSVKQICPRYVDTELNLHCKENMFTSTIHSLQCSCAETLASILYTGCRPILGLVNALHLLVGQAIPREQKIAWKTFLCFREGFKVLGNEYKIWFWSSCCQTKMFQLCSSNTLKS